MESLGIYKLHPTVQSPALSTEDSACADVFAFIQGKEITALFYFCVVVSVLVVYTHRTNIKRLRNGNENKFSFKKKTVNA